MIARPMIKATTGLPCRGVEELFPPSSCLLNRSVASKASRLVDIRMSEQGCEDESPKYKCGSLRRQPCKAMSSLPRHQTDPSYDSYACNFSDEILNFTARELQLRPNYTLRSYGKRK